MLVIPACLFLFPFFCYLTLSFSLSLSLSISLSLSFSVSLSHTLHFSLSLYLTLPLILCLCLSVSIVLICRRRTLIGNCWRERTQASARFSVMKNRQQCLHKKRSTHGICLLFVHEKYLWKMPPVYVFDLWIYSSGLWIQAKNSLLLMN